MTSTPSDRTTTRSRRLTGDDPATQRDESAERNSAEWRDHNKVLFTERALLQSELDEMLEHVDPTSRVAMRRVERKRRAIEDKTNDIVEFNFGLVRNYVRRFTGSSSRDDTRDFEAAGMLGLMKAIDTYDPDRGSFAQWAFKPIQREVLRAVHASDHSNMTSGDFERRPAILRAWRKLQNGDENARPPYEDVAAEAGVTFKQVVRVLEAPRMESMHTPVGDGDSTLGELIEDPGDALDDQVIDSQTVQDLQTYGLSALDTRELFVLTRRLGLDCEPEQRLSAIGEMLGLSREAVRQIESKAISKLSHPVLLRKLARNGRR